MKQLKLPNPPVREKTIDGRYKVVREIGHGATGAVYEGVQIAVDRRVAIKILHKAYESRSDYKERFNREAQAIARLSHTNCITLYDFGYSEEFESLYMVMELVDGEELYHILKQGRLPFRRALKIGIQIAEALGHAHKHGILHRDLKPENVIVTRDDEVKVLDFGLARMLDLFNEGGGGRRLTADGAVFGTPAYMSPEQCAGERDVTVQSDIYSLGVLLFQLFQGELPFDSKDVVQILVQHAKDPPPPISAPIPQKLRSLIMRMLEKDKAKRPATAAEVADTLRSALIDLAVDEGELRPDVSQEIQRSLLGSPSYQSTSRESASFAAARRSTEGSLPNRVMPHNTMEPESEASIALSQSEETAVRKATLELSGEKLGSCLLGELLGQGPHGTVYLGREDQGDVVTVKFLAADAMDDGSADRFEANRNTLLDLRHRTIATVRDFRRYDDRWYIKADYAAGDALSRLCSEGRASVELAMIVAKEAAAALKAMHDKGVLHREIRSSNIAVCPQSNGMVTTKVLDVALSTVLPSDDQTSATGGKATVAYMPPERLKGEEVDERSDIYSLGVVLYEMLCGHVPFEGKTSTRLAQSVVMGNAPALASFVHEVPQSLSDLIQEMMDKERARRPRSAAHLISRIDAIAPNLKLKQFRVEHMGTAEAPADAWRLRRRVHPPAPSESTTRTRSNPPAQSVHETILPPIRRGPRVFVGLVVLLLVAAAIAVALHYSGVIQLPVALPEL